MSTATMPVHPGSNATREELQAYIEALEIYTKDQKAVKSNMLEFRIGEKGGVSVYGLGRFPVTLYYAQWVKLMNAGPELIDFLEDAVTSGKILAEKPAKAQATTTRPAQTLAQSARVAERTALRLVPMYRSKTDAELDAILDATQK